MYLEYLKYVLEHKKNVFKCCFKKGKEKWRSGEKDTAIDLFIHAFTHDMSKFKPSEFIPYAKWFYGKCCSPEDPKIMIPIKLATGCNQKYKRDFEVAWKLHYTCNKHHWNYWENQTMPYKYILQMICDWEAMGMKFGNSAATFYINNCEKIKLAAESKLLLEKELGLI